MNSCAEPSTNPRRALTLLELLVAIALFGALMVAVLAFLSDMLSARERLREVTARDRAASALLEAIERDLASSMVGDATRGAGVAGSATSIELLRRGVPVQLAGRGLAGGDPLADLERSTYRFDETARSIEVARALVRLAPAATDASAAEVEAETAAPAPATLASFARVRFAYHDGRRWRDSFDSLVALRLPKAVEVAIWYESDAESEPVPGRAPVESTFDERAFAFESDPVEVHEAPPDRIRVIAIPDPEPDGEPRASFADASRDSR